MINKWLTNVILSNINNIYRVEVKGGSQFPIYYNVYFSVINLTYLPMTLNNHYSKSINVFENMFYIVSNRYKTTFKNIIFLNVGFLFIQF